MRTAFASDFDGTLYFRTRTPDILPADIEAILAYQAAGNLFGFCSGRPVGGLLPFLPKEIVPDFFICSSGAHISDKAGRVLYERTIPFEAVREIFDRYDSPLCAGNVHMDGRYYMIRQDPELKNENLPFLPDIEHARNGKIHNISFRTPSEKNAARTARDINERYGDIVAAFQNVTSIDIVNHDCSKGKGVLILREALNIKRIAGIGDSMNDLPLIEAADISFTFPHAPERLKEAAVHIVGTVGEAISLFS